MGVDVEVMGAESSNPRLGANRHAEGPPQDPVLALPREQRVTAIADRTTSVIRKEPDGALHVCIRTPRLELTPVTPADTADYYAKLFGNPKATEKFGDGKPKSYEVVEKRVNSWAGRWAEGDPFAGLAVRLRSTGELIGNVVVGYSEQAEQAEVAYIFSPDHWEKRYGLEAAIGAVVHLAPLVRAYALASAQLAGHGVPPFVTKYHDNPVPGPTFAKLDATANADHVASQRILAQVGIGEFQGTVVRSGTEKNVYTGSWNNPPRDSRWSIYQDPTGRLVFTEAARGA